MIAPIPSQVDEADSYAKLVNSLEEMIKIRDGVQWSVGDALQGVETRYSDCTIEAIADEVGMSPSSLYDWRTLSTFYVPIIRQHYTEKGLSYSHFRIAYREFPTIDGAYSFLDLCVAKKWTVRGAAIEAKERKGIDTAAPLPRLTPELVALVDAYIDRRNHDTYASHDDTNALGDEALWALIQLVRPGYDVPGWNL